MQALRAFLHSVRRQPNLSAIAAGLFLFAAPDPFLDAARLASGKYRYDDSPTPQPPPAQLAPLIDFWGEFADSSLGEATARTLMAAGILFAVLGMARTFRPKENTTNARP